MKDDIEQFLNTSRPSMLPHEKSALWTCIHSSFTSTSVRSPYEGWIRTHARLAGAFAILLIAVAGSTTSALAEQARPGDALFPLDRALERVRFSFAQSDEKRSQLGIANAEERITELRELIQTTHNPKDGQTSTSTHVHVGTAVDALVRVLEESNMSETARERVYENLFVEIDSLSVDVRVNERGVGDAQKERVTVNQDERGETKIEIRETEKRTRIEKKDGRIRVEYERDGEVRGINSDKKSKSGNED